MRSFPAVSASAQSIRSRSRSVIPPRRPMKRMRTPSSLSSGVSDWIRSANMTIRPSTSSRGRLQFSVEKAYAVSSSTSSLTALRTVRLSAWAPSRCPSRTGTPRPFAQHAQFVHHVPPDVADGHPALLRALAYDLHQLLAALLGELRDRQPDHVAVVRRGEAHVGLHDRLLDRLDRRLVVWRDREQARLA